MNRLTPPKQSQVIAAHLVGNSIRATVRMTGAWEAGIADHVWGVEEIVKSSDLSNSREVAA